jgi:hypothetical protein
LVADIEPSCLTLDSVFVYVVGTASDGLNVRRIPKTGGAADVAPPQYDATDCVASATGLVMAHSTGVVYWLSLTPPFSFLGYVATDQQGVTALALSDPGVVAWTRPNLGLVASCSQPKCNALPQIVEEGAGAPYGIALDASHYYFTEKSSGEISRRVRTLAEQSETLGSGLGNPIDIALDESFAYVASEDGTVVKLAKEQPEIEKLATGQGALTSIALSHTHVYWSSGTGVIARVAKSGGEPLVLAEGQQNPSAVAVDQTHVYWINRGSGGAVVRVAK